MKIIRVTLENIPIQMIARIVNVMIHVQNMSIWQSGIDKKRDDLGHPPNKRRPVRPLTFAGGGGFTGRVFRPLCEVGKHEADRIYADKSRKSLFYKANNSVK